MLEKIYRIAGIISLSVRYIDKADKFAVILVAKYEQRRLHGNTKQFVTNNMIAMGVVMPIEHIRMIATILTHKEIKV